MVKVKKCCGTCKYWAKPPEKKATAHAVFPCVAPLPVVAWPDSVMKYTDQAFISRCVMLRDEGTKCPCWQAKTVPWPGT